MTLPWTSPIFWALSFAITVITGLLAGSYPAFYLSGFRPVRVLKGAFKTGKGASLPRKVIVVAQFSISLSLIIGALVVFRQIQYAKDLPVGYDRAGLINIPINTDSLDRHYEPLRTSLLNTGVVAGVATSSTLLTAFYENNFMEWPGMTEEQKNISFRDIHVNGFKSRISKHIPWLEKTKLYCWFDLDGAGFEMLNMVREHYSNAISFLMDDVTLRTFEKFVVYNNPKIKTLSYLLPTEQRLYHYLVKEGKRLEQEKTSQQYVLQQIDFLPS